MSLLFPTSGVNETPELTTEIAQSAYNAFSLGKSQKDMLEQDNILIEHSNLVKQEISSMRNQITIKMSDLENQPETQADLVSLITSDLLDIPLFVADTIKFSKGDPDQIPPVSYEEYKAIFTNNDLI